MPRPSVVSVASSTTIMSMDHIRNLVIKRRGGLSRHVAEAADEHDLPFARQWYEIWKELHLSPKLRAQRSHRYFNNACNT